MAEHDEQQALAPQNGVGPRLKAARESAGLSLADMADRTKIPARMLTLMEAGDFAGLPARTYATGFTRSYARSLGLDEQAMVASVRAELGMQDQTPARVAPAFEPGDPSRVPTARFAWLAAVAALVVVAAGLFLWRTYYAPAVTLPSLLPEEAASAAPSTAVPVPVPVVVPLPAPVPAASMPALAATAAASEAAAQATAAPAAPQTAARAASPRRVQPRQPAPAPSAAPVSTGAAAPAPTPASTAQN